MNRLTLLLCVVVGVGCEAPEVSDAETIQVDEPREAAPSFNREAVVVSQGPDLRVMSVSTTFSAIARNTTGTVTATVCNHGSLASPATTVSALVSSDTTLTSADPVVGTGKVAALTPGQCVTTNISSTFTPSTGSYYLGAWVDRSDLINEEVESNNSLRGGTVYIGSRSDLTVSVLSAPTSSAPNTAFTVQLRVCNTGSASASLSSANVRRSTDATINTSDTSIGSASVGTVGAGACQTVNVSASSAAVNEQYLGATVSTVSTEVSTNNNSALAGVFAVGNKADLVIESLSHAIVGNALQTNMTVCNRGKAAAVASVASVHLSVDASLDANDTQLGTIAIQALSVNACVTTSQSHALPAIAGTRTALARVDANNSISELFEANNVRAGLPLVLGADLHVSQFDVTHDGAQFIVTSEVCNQGSATAAATVLGVFQSVDAQLDVNDALVASIATPSLAVNTCTTVTGSFSVQSAPGEFTFIARADDANTVSESNETNNTRISATTGINADLVVTSTTSWVQDEQVWWNVRVCNHGNLTTGSTSVAAELTLSNDVALHTHVLPELIPGACVDLVGNSSTSVRGSRALVVSVDGANALPEANELNNTGTSTTFFIGADLVVQAVTVAVSWAQARNEFAVTTNTCNQGSLTGYTNFTAWLSTDEVLGNDIALQANSPNGAPLAPGQCVTNTMPMTQQSGPPVRGTYRVLVQWPYDDTPELSATASAPLSLGYDLVLQSASVTAVWNGSESRFNITTALCNAGNQAAPDGPVSAMVAQVPGGNIVWLNATTGQPMNQLQPGACRTTTNQYAPQSSLNDGNYSVSAYFYAADDIDPSNNQIPPMPVTLRADMSLQNATMGITWGGNEPRLSLTATVCNSGTRPGSVPAMAILSNDPSLITGPDTTLSPVNWSATSVAPGECQPLSSTYSVPSSVADGNWHAFFQLYAFEDPTPQNNVVGPFPVMLGVDFAVSNVTVTRSTYASEPRFLFGGQICNVGTRAGNGGIVGVLSTDQLHDPFDITLSPVNYDFVTLMPGQCQTIASEQRGTVTAGTFFGVLHVPSWGELNTANNSAVSALPVTVNATTADIELTATNTETMWNGSNYDVTITSTFCNRGGNPANVQLTVMLSTDQVLDPSDTSLTSVGTPPSWNVAGGACETVTHTMLAGSNFANGAHFAFVTAYANVDSNPANNTLVSPSRVTIGGDLEVHTLTATVAFNGSAVDMTSTIELCNRGPQTNWATLKLAFSADAQFDAADSMISMTPHTLEPGECTTSTVSGTYWNGFFVHPVESGLTHLVASLEAGVDFNLSNNTKSTSAVPAHGADYELRSFDVTMLSLDLVQVEAEICNVGDVAGWSVELVTELTGPESSQTLYPMWDEPLAPGACVHFNRMMGVNQPLIDGVTYQATGSIPWVSPTQETNRTNNTAVDATPLQLFSDFMVQSFTHQVTVDEWNWQATITVSSVVCNEGTVVASRPVSVFLARNATLEPYTDMQLTSQGIQLEPGTCTTFSASQAVYASQLVDFGYLAFAVDAFEYVPDANRSNNIAINALSL